jgi:DNA ligase (NAD+)
MCLSCGKTLQWEFNFLKCVNHSECLAQVIGKMEYFFKILGNNNGFGIATIKKFYENDVRKISEIYRLTHKDLIKIGFSDKTSKNLIIERRRSSKEQIEDWRFLAAFGIARLGMGNCENLLRSCLLNDIFTLNLEKIINIKGFSELTAQVIILILLNSLNVYA